MFYHAKMKTMEIKWRQNFFNSVSLQKTHKKRWKPKILSQKFIEKFVTTKHDSIATGWIEIKFVIRYFWHNYASVLIRLLILFFAATKKCVRVFLFLTKNLLRMRLYRPILSNFFVTFIRRQRTIVRMKLTVDRTIQKLFNSFVIHIIIICCYLWSFVQSNFNVWQKRRERKRSGRRETKIVLRFE